MEVKRKPGRVEDVKIPLEVILGETSLKLEDFASLGPGSIIELDRACGEPALLKAGDHVIARGEVVVIDENFGLRVTEVLDGRS